jgi:type IV pilus assembly protein PilY1
MHREIAGFVRLKANLQQLRLVGSPSGEHPSAFQPRRTPKGVPTAQLHDVDAPSGARRVLLVSAFFALISSASHAGPLSLSNNALEVAISVEPNIMVVTDDSGSMNWEVMTTDYANGGLFTGTQRDGSNPAGSGSAKHRDSNDDGTADCAFNSGTFYGYLYIVEFGSNTYSDDGLDCNTADDQEWRIRNSDFNPLYFDPDKTYEPWAGVDINGNAFADIAITNAPNNPYNPTEFIDLTQHNSNWGGSATRLTSDRDGDGAPDGFRYYTWQDTNSNGLFDDGEQTEHLIKNESAAVKQNFANWFSYYRSRDLTAKAALSHSIEPAENARIGYATINNNAGNRIRVASMNISPSSGNKKSLLDNLYSTEPLGGTPLRLALRNTGRYFNCAANDIFDAAAGSTPGSANCPVFASPAGECQQNYTILMSDGFWNGNDPAVGNVDDDGGDFAGGAYADSYSNTLADVAMQYYKTDLHASLTNAVPATQRDIAGYLGTTSPFEVMHQHMATYTVGFGVTGSLSAGPPNPSSAFVWPDPFASDAAKIDDLRHAAYNGRGQFLSANDPVALTGAMTTIFSDIAKATGTATAVAFNTQEIAAGSLVFRASFNTKTNKGDLVAQQINPDGTLESNIEWSAAERLDLKVSAAADTRTIISYKDTGSATSAGIPFQWSDLLAAQQTLLDAPQPANIPAATNTFGDERLNYLRGQSQHEGENYDNGEFRARSTVAGKLGDIVHSTPVFVGKPEFLGRDGGVYPQTAGNYYSEFATARQFRTELVYVGANDGMLHAFNANNGSEQFAYVPNLVMQNLSNLTDPAYTHRFYADLTPAANDAYITPTTGGTNNGSLSWNTVLIGGLGGGGKGYYALNVTDPGAFDNATSAMSNVLWEFTEADDGGVGASDLGYTFSQPLITMSNADNGGNKKWVAIFGNGYNSTSASGNATLYVLFLEGGQDGVWTAGADFIKINTGYGKATSADGSTPNGIGGIRGIDADGNGTVDYVYAGDLQGNLFRFDLTSATPSSWTDAPKLLFLARYAASNAFPRSIVQPITTRPVAMRHPEGGGFIVIAATGSWMTSVDATSTGIQSMYGIWDDMSNDPEVTMSSTANQLVKQVFTNQASTEHGYTVRTLTNNPVTWRNTGAASSKVKGWYIDLDVPTAGGGAVEFPGERAVRNLQLRGGLVFVNTIIPKETEACSAGAGGFELGFNPLTGGSGSNIIFDIDADNDFTIEDNISNALGDENIVTGIRFDADTPTDAAFIGSRRITQAGDDIRSFATNTGEDTNTGRTSWREIGQ